MGSERLTVNLYNPIYGHSIQGGDNPISWSPAGLTAPPFGSSCRSGGTQPQWAGPASLMAPTIPWALRHQCFQPVTVRRRRLVVAFLLSLPPP
ncbi:UNVERIFIED_CONTAM: hypothetical protein K2H54_017442 [Gekko kuhli]